MASNADIRPLDAELHHYRLGAIDVYLHDWAEGTRLYKRAGGAETAGDAAEHDGPAIVDGHFRRFEHDGLVVGYHPHAGYRETHAPDDRFDEPAVLLREVRRLA
jgi:hypothetical protein